MGSTRGFQPNRVVYINRFLHALLPDSCENINQEKQERKLLLVWPGCLGVNELMHCCGIKHSSGLLVPETSSMASEDVFTIKLLA